MTSTDSLAFSLHRHARMERGGISPNSSSKSELNRNTLLAQQLAGTWQVRLRLVIAFPVLLSLFMLAAGFLSARLIIPLFTPRVWRDLPRV